VRPLVFCFVGEEGLTADRRERLSRLLPEADVVDPYGLVAADQLRRPIVAVSWGSACIDALGSIDLWLAGGRDVRWAVLVAPPRVLLQRPSVPCTIVLGSESDVPIGLPNANVVRLDEVLAVDGPADSERVDIEVTGVIAAGLFTIA
jgi:hypothetical protein